MANKIIKWIIGLLCLATILSALCGHFDFDFGWHLRFGQEVAQTGIFPHLDTYSYFFAGQPWVNHEWGNDLIVWQIYRYIGYWPLLLLVAGAIFGAFLIVQKIFTRQITTPNLVITALLLTSISHIFVVRPAMYSLLFFAVLWRILENLPNKKSYYFWPPLIWLWSAVHGSWVLAFIVIGIYMVGNILNTIAKRYYHTLYLPHHNWDYTTYRNVLIWATVSSLVIVANPYGLSIFHEVLGYFEPAFFKQYITEWVSSYTYPIFWQSLIWVAPSAVLMFVGWRKKLISWPQIFLFMAFFASGWQYKRNMMFFILICQPLLSAGLDWMIATARPCVKKYHERYSRGIIYTTTLILLAILFYQTGKNIRFDRDIWQNYPLLAANDMPVQAVDFLQTELPTHQKTPIFNEFVWGGYMIWALPQAQIFLDGRGTATWKMPGQNITAFEFYHQLAYDRPDGLQWIDNSGAQYIMLQKMSNGFYPPDTINRLFFNQTDLKKIFNATPSMLETQLTKNSNWQLIYSDTVAQIWKKLATR